MRDIYAMSQKTTIWLGAKDAASSEIIVLLKKLANAQSDPDTGITLYGKEPVWKELGALCSNSWFYRIWVIQEIAVAKSVVIILNQDEIWE